MYGELLVGENDPKSQSSVALTMDRVSKESHQKLDIGGNFRLPGSILKRPVRTSVVTSSHRGSRSKRFGCSLLNSRGLERRKCEWRENIKTKLSVPLSGQFIAKFAIGYSTRQKETRRPHQQQQRQLQQRQKNQRQQQLRQLQQRQQQQRQLQQRQLQQQQSHQRQPQQQRQQQQQQQRNSGCLSKGISYSMFSFLLFCSLFSFAASLINIPIASFNLHGFKSSSAYLKSSIAN